MLSAALLSDRLPDPGEIRLLIVDDEPRFRQSLRILLAQPDREIHCCATIAEARAALRLAEYDLVLLDLGLPDGDGLAILSWLKAHAPRTHAVVISAESRMDAAIDAIRRGALDFVRKPFSVEYVQYVAARALEHRRLQRHQEALAARLKSSEWWHRSLIEHSPDLIYTLDPQGRFSFVNRRFETLLDYSATELLGVHFSQLLASAWERTDAIAFAERRRGERAATNVEVELLRKGGALGRGASIWIALCATGVYEDTAGNAAPPKERFLGTFGVGRDITDQKQARDRIRFLALHDGLTGLANRGLFRDRLEMSLHDARRQNSRIGVMFLDLDRFKLINDTLGHDVGDELLQAAALRLQSCLRAGDTVARRGGDEFNILLPRLQIPHDAALVAEKIVQAFRKPFFVGGHEMTTTVSIGIAVFPEDAPAADALIQRADQAMYQVKARGKNCYEFFDLGKDAAGKGRLALEDDLRRGLDRGEFELHYQPQVSVAQRRVVGVEALIRWRHPQQGVVAPARFMGIAEECGLIGRLSNWIIDAACAQLREWHENGWSRLRMAVNVSPLDFARADLVSNVQRALEKNGLPPGALDLEITENALLDIARAIETIRALRTLGVRISIDDFGVGYSSLTYLRDLPVGTLKIDRHFVTCMGEDERSRSVVRAIVAVAKGLGLHVIAEGVETQGQAIELQTLGCYEMQGYYFSRPLPGGAIRHVLMQQPQA